MEDLIKLIAVKLLELREKYLELDCRSPFWVWLGIKWCVRWFSVHGDDYVES